MGRGQVTIEFMLLLIVVLVIISTVSLPLIQYTTDTLVDTAGGIVLSQEVMKIVKTSDDIAMSGCGSFRRIFIDQSQLDALVNYYNINISSGIVKGMYLLRNGSYAYLKPYSVPNYVDFKYNDTTGSLLITKDCDTPTPHYSIRIGSE